LEIVPVDDAVIERENILSEDGIEHIDQSIDAASELLDEYVRLYTDDWPSSNEETFPAFTYSEIFEIDLPEGFEPEEFDHPEALNLEMQSRLRENVYERTQDISQERLLTRWWQRDHIDRYNQAYTETYLTQPGIDRHSRTDVKDLDKLKAILQEGYDEASAVIEEYDDFAFSQYERADRDYPELNTS
jgi:hypothetical protein